MRIYKNIRTVPTDWRQGPRSGKRREPQPDYSGDFERSQPARGASRESDVLVPFLQAAITGAFTAIMLGIGAGVVVHWQAWPWWYVAIVVALSWLFVTSGVWLRLLNDSRELLWKVESWTDRDLDQDGTTGKPQEPTETVRLEIEANNNGRHSSFFHDLPTEPAVFTTWVQVAVNGQSLAVGHWTGNGRPFSRSDYEALLDFLQGAGVVAWQNPDAPAQGRRVTKPGKAALQAWLGGAI
jgi:hypothetical protein